MKHFHFRLVMFLLGLCSLLSCSYAPFRVQPKVTLPAERFTQSATMGSIRVSALALRDEDECYRRFDGNLFLFNVFPIQIQFENQGASPSQLNRLRFMLRDATGRELPPVSAKKVLDRQIRFYGYRAYSAQGFKDVQATYRGYSFPEKMTIEAGAAQQGIVFFDLPGGVRQVSNAFTLEISGWDKTKGPLRIQLP
ncbi:MAG: hypothetical protein K1Y36_02630 [Blastocatellia bacterium]|nr:hypothetical protein [Blastocatellia bacterium]